MGGSPASEEVILERLAEDGIEQLWVVYHDYSGRAGAKTIPKEGFRTAVRDGVVFAMANLDFDLLDHQVAGASLLADSGDFLAVPDPRSYTIMPQYPNTARMHAWMRSTTGSPWEGCPRTRLDAMIDRLATHGYCAQVAFEPEFYLLTRDADGHYTPSNSTRMFTDTGLAVENPFIQRLFTDLRRMGMAIAPLGKEYGPGQYEMTAQHGAPIEAVDRYLLLKSAVREAARSFGHVATFMPKPYADWSGSSLHVHLSVWNSDGTIDLTPCADDNTSLSDVGCWFMGGLLHHVAALTGLGAPTVNSYKRLQPGTWAPANTYWGYGNRSGVIRIPGVGTRRHIEFRAGDNSCQPYLFLTGLLAAGLDGIRNRIDPGPAFQRDIAHLTPAELTEHNIGFLPRTLSDALSALEHDRVIVDSVGEEALKHFLLVKRHEQELFQLHVHPWEREAYLEVI